MHFCRQLNYWSLRCSWSIACRRCSNYIFILYLTPGFNRLGKDKWKTRRESFNFWDSVWLILEILRYVQWQESYICIHVWYLADLCHTYILWLKVISLHTFTLTSQTVLEIPASPRPTTLEQDRELFVHFFFILCLWFETWGPTNFFTEFQTLLLLWLNSWRPCGTI